MLTSTQILYTSTCHDNYIKNIHHAVSSAVESTDSYLVMNDRTTYHLAIIWLNVPL